MTWKKVLFTCATLAQELTGPRDFKIEHNKIDKNELQICKNLHRGTGTKMPEKLNNFQKFDRKKNQNSP